MLKFPHNPRDSSVRFELEFELLCVQDLIGTEKIKEGYLLDMFDSTKNDRILRYHDANLEYSFDTFFLGLWRLHVNLPRVFAL